MADTSTYFDKEGRFDYDAFLSAATARTKEIGTVGGLDQKLPESLLSGWQGSLDPNQLYLYYKQSMPWQQAAQKAGIQIPTRFGRATAPYVYGKTPQAPTINQGQWDAALKSFEAQKATLTGQATKAAEAFKAKTTGTIQQLKALEAASAKVQGVFGEGIALWTQAADKANEYVKEGYKRMADVTGRLEEIFREMETSRDFAKAHAMNAGVQSVLGSMESQGREIAMQFGRDSKEYQQFQENRTIALGQMQSQIHSSYQSFKEQGQQAFMQAYGTAAVDMATHISYKEQQHVDVLTQQARYAQEYEFAHAQFQLSVAQLQGTVLEDWGNYLVATPEFYMDVSPFLSLYSRLSQPEVEQEVK